MKNQLIKLLTKLKELYLRFQAVPLLGFILFVIYMIIKVTTCASLGYCPVL